MRAYSNFILITLVFFSSTLFSKNLSEDFNLLVQQKGQLVNEKFANKKVTISFATPLKQVSDYWRKSIDSFKKRMNEIGIDYTVNEFSTKTDENRKLRESIRLALKTNPDYLVVTPNDPDDEKIITRLLAKHNVKVIIQNTTIPNENWEYNPPLIYVGFDHKIGTKKIASEYIKRFKDKKNVKYAVLYFIKGSQVSKLRGDYFNEVIRENTNFNLVAEFYTGGNRDRAKNSTLQILKKHSDIDFIYACSTDIAFGALDALKEKGLYDKIIINGWGGGSGELESIIEKELDFTVMRINDDNGVAMAEAIKLDLESKPIPKIFSGKMVIVNQKIDVNSLNNLKKKAFRYSGK